MSALNVRPRVLLVGGMLQLDAFDTGLDGEIDGRG